MIFLRYLDELERDKAELKVEAYQFIIDEETWDLGVNNPNTPVESPLHSPEEILTPMEKFNGETNSILQSLKELI